MKIRKLTLEDIKPVNKIRNHYISTTKNICRSCKKSLEDDIDFFTEILNNDYPVVVCDIDGDIVGFAYLSPFRNTDGYDKTMELSIYLSPNYVSKGLGTMLLKEIEAMSKEKYHVIVSVITSSNEDSIKFHLKNDFNIFGEMKDACYLDGNYFDITFMQKLI